MGITKITVVSVPVTDQQRAKAFYVGTLGFDLITEAPMGDGNDWVQVGPAGKEVSLTLVNWFPEMQPGSLHGLVVACDDIQATYDDLKGKGVTFDGPPDKTPWGIFATLRDPDGNSLVLHENAGAGS